MEIIEIVRKGRPLFVMQLTVRDLDKSKCSHKFLQHNFPDDMQVYVKCHHDGILDLRGKKEEYRIIVPDNLIQSQTRISELPSKSTIRDEITLTRE